MKTSYWFLAVVAIVVYNGILIKRDQELFKAHDACNKLTQQQNCPYQNK